MKRRQYQEEGLEAVQKRVLRRIERMSPLRRYLISLRVPGPAPDWVAPELERDENIQLQRQLNKYVKYRRRRSLWRKITIAVGACCIVMLGAMAIGAKERKTAILSHTGQLFSGDIVDVKAGGINRQLSVISAALGADRIQFTDLADEISIKECKIYYDSAFAIVFGEFREKACFIEVYAGTSDYATASSGQYEFLESIENSIFNQPAEIYRHIENGNEEEADYVAVIAVGKSGYQISGFEDPEALCRLVEGITGS